MTTLADGYDAWVRGAAESMADAAAERRARYSLDGGAPFTLHEFLTDNPDLSDVERARVRSLQIGATLTLGGGAAAEFELTRLPSVYE
jgi:hypothetical protein